MFNESMGVETTEPEQTACGQSHKIDVLSEEEAGFARNVRPQNPTKLCPAGGQGALF